MRALSPPVIPWWQRFAGSVAGIEVPAVIGRGQRARRAAAHAGRALRASAKSKRGGYALLPAPT
jgi:hypothetical protein